MIEINIYACRFRARGITVCTDKEYVNFALKNTSELVSSEINISFMMMLLTYSESLKNKLQIIKNLSQNSSYKL